jgi:hypothetical protein
MRADEFRLVLSLLTVLRNCCGRLPCVAGPDDGSAVGLPSATYNALMLLCMLAFWALTTWGLFQYSLQTPATLGRGAAYYDRSYRLLRACSLPRRSLHASTRKLYWMPYFVYTSWWRSDTFDYAEIVPLRRLNYLSSKAPQMLWAYVLLTVINLPHQDAVALARICSTAAAGATDASPMAAARASMHGSAVHGAHSIGSASTQAPAEKPHRCCAAAGATYASPRAPARESMHSFRSALCTRRCMMRWSSEAARKLYALAMTTQCSLRAGAVDANFDSIRAHTLLDASAPTGASADMQAAAEALREATGLLDAVTVETGTRVASSAYLRHTRSIDDDASFRHARRIVQRARGTLPDSGSDDES